MCFGGAPESGCKLEPFTILDISYILGFGLYCAARLS